MKKRIVLIIALVTMICSLCLSGCDKKCDHTYGNWTTIKAAACTEDGEKERTCSECGHKETEKINASGHDFVNGICTECGSSE